MDEQIDSVTQGDKVIGATTRDKAHKEGQIHRVVVAYLSDDQGNILMQYNPQKNLYDHSVGGHVAKGEGYEDAIHREMLEELNTSMKLNFSKKIYSDESNERSKYRHIYAIFEGSLSDGWQFVPNAEVKDVKFFSPQQLIEMITQRPELFTPGFLSTWQALFGKNSEVKP